MVKQHIIEELKVDFTQHLQGVKDQAALTILKRGCPKSKLLVRLGRYLSENDVKKLRHSRVKEVTPAQLCLYFGLLLPSSADY